ncbi:vang-like protein 2 isoform X2 [Nilaparvata lugens]|uniref:vang-like protein 2 isoform X1 n=1 Tax=Nilaparvata lugens TaxID=108931 RepID=UPI00193E30BB|nr:vang-like protein 2 isoform X1 [Nilaparvata lugens]XP_039289405.1 vang-like protein 2 isoform X2 [Nilaparvata lugens]
MRGLLDNQTDFGMETESIKSALSEQSSKSKRSRSHNHRSSHRNHSHRNNSSLFERGEHLHRKGGDMAPFQTAVTMSPDDGQEVIEVQILPQDENWGENTTAVTGNTSEQSGGSVEDVGSAAGGGGWGGAYPDEGGLAFVCQRYVGTVMSAVISMAAFLSPVAMVVLPKIGVLPEMSSLSGGRLLACGAECRGVLVSLVIKLALLLVGAWALFWRSPSATMPRLFLLRAAVLLLVVVTTIAYWLFYLVQITEGVRAAVTGEPGVEYRALVGFASSLTETLLFVHYVAVALLELRHLQPTYYVRVTRSPDGECRSYAIGRLSIQRAAVWLLQRYYCEFPIYNPYLDRPPTSSKSRHAKASSFKYYDVDSNMQMASGGRVVGGRGGSRRDSSHNERFYEEHDWERRVRKRRARLISATEDAFTHIKRQPHLMNTGGGVLMEPEEAAAAVFPGLARALQKYLRVTRQQPWHSPDSILQHLAHCLAHDLSPQAFLQPYMQPAPVLMNEKERVPVQTWSLVCGELLSRPLRPGCSFQLRQKDVSLLCQVVALPHLNLTEEVIDPTSNRFVLRLNSETSV